MKKFSKLLMLLFIVGCINTSLPTLNTNVLETNEAIQTIEDNLECDVTMH